MSFDYIKHLASTTIQEIVHNETEDIFHNLFAMDLNEEEQLVHILRSMAQFNDLMLNKTFTRLNLDGEKQVTIKRYLCSIINGDAVPLL